MLSTSPRFETRVATVTDYDMDHELWRGGGDLAWNRDAALNGAADVSLFVSAASQTESVILQAGRRYGGESGWTPLFNVAMHRLPRLSGTTSSTADAWIGDALEFYRKQHPDQSFELRTGMTPSTTRRLTCYQPWAFIPRGADIQHSETPLSHYEAWEIVRVSLKGADVVEATSTLSALAKFLMDYDEPDQKLPSRLREGLGVGGEFGVSGEVPILATFVPTP
jgi:hypothetical protein